MCLSHAVPGGSCLLQSLSRGSRAARIMGMGWIESPPQPPYIFIYSLTRPLPIPRLLCFQGIWFLHTPMVSTGGANPATCTSPLQQHQVWSEGALWPHRGRLCFNWLFFLGLAYWGWLDFIGSPDMQPTHKAFRSLMSPWRGTKQGPTWHCSTIHHVSNLHSSGSMIC